VEYRWCHPPAKETQMQEAKDGADGVPQDLIAARMRALMVRAPLAVGFVKDGSFTLVSEHFNHLFGHGDDTDLGGQAIRSVHVSDAALSSINERMAAAFVSGRPLDDEFEYVRRDGSRFWGRLQATPVQWDVPAGEALWLLDDVTVARQLRMQPTWTAKHDALTELANRREFERRLAEHVGSRRHEPVSVLWVDVDHFSEVIAGMGVEVADHFLYGLGQLLITKVRASDLVARLENDCFAVLLPNCDQHYAEIVAEKMRAGIAGFRLRWGLHRTRVKACVGVVQLQSTLESVDAVIGAALLACTEAKAAGGDSVRVFISTGAFEELAG
jgi:diguanylate cyclase (GGDEF)-like protein/PAS domain S-box-containing protein